MMINNRFDDQEMKKRVSLFFDKALSKEDEKSFLNEVNRDPHITKLYQQEKSAREFIRKNVRRPNVPPDMIANIWNKIR